MKLYIDQVPGLTSTGTSYEPGGPKFNHEEPGGSMNDCLTLVPKETHPKSNRKEPVGSTSDHLTIVLNKYVTYELIIRLRHH